MHQALIIQHLFQVGSLEDVSRERLESFVEANPSFGIGHYLLSRKLQAEEAGSFQASAQRTSLYFSNPLWLQWQLENEDMRRVNGTPELQPEMQTPPDIAETPEVPAPAVRETPQDHPLQEPVIENVVTMAEEAYVAPAAGDDLAEALTSGETETFTAFEIENTTAGEGEHTGDGIHAGDTPTIEASAGNGEPSSAELLLRSIEDAKELRGSMQHINDDFISVPAEDLAPETAIAGEGLPEEAHDEPAPAQTETAHELEEPIQPQTEIVHELQEPIKDEEKPFVLDEAETVERPAPPPPPAANTTQDLVFEPFHTIDYFASQGIKLTLDDNPADTLGKQLKSFTDWLKVMRRLPQKDREVIPDRVAEEAIQSYAAHSIEGKDVLTETMAEVLAKQGMREKARAVYEKLSLLNPDKRAYFAAKIEQLNIR